MPNFVEQIHAHFVELQMGGLIATFIVLVLALFLLNRVASELYRSRSQRLKTEQTFERLSVLLSSRGLGEGAFDEARPARRVSLTGPAMRTSRPVQTKPDYKPTPRNEPKPAPISGRGMGRKQLH